MKINKSKDTKKVKVKEEEVEEEMKKSVPTEPFSIKKSGSVIFFVKVEKRACY